MQRKNRHSYISVGLFCDVLKERFTLSKEKKNIRKKCCSVSCKYLRKKLLKFKEF